ncbi:MAG: preprotein translocase subunit SecY [Candidatus Schekmanbacteria bacterium]|nr:MAG: preprotein translocase subunit SecY [Candidatus Schekmanbacteria bacterium]
MIETFQNIFKVPELKKRIFFTFALLAVYRIGAHIPVPGIDAQALADFFSANQGSILGFFDMFSGGALRRLTIFALGIMPYISASIILQLLTVVIPALEKLSKEGETGRKKITQYTRYGTVILSMIQGLGISYGLEQMKSPVSGAPLIIEPGWSFRLLSMLTLTAGTAFIMWLGEQITEKGIGNGISLIIFAGIVVRMPSAITNSIQAVNRGDLNAIFMTIVLVFVVVITGVIIFVEKGQRRIPVQYAKRVVGRKVYGGQSTHIPLKVNTAGVIPIIFASSILMFPATIAGFYKNQFTQMITELLSPGSLLYETIYVIMIIFFCYFYTAIIFNPVDLADNMKKYGGFIPGIRPGKRTSDYIDRVLMRITFGGALYLSAVSVLPNLLIVYGHVPFYFGGTALLIVVGVALDTISQIESHLMTRNYEGFLKKGKFKGRR